MPPKAKPVPPPPVDVFAGVPESRVPFGPQVLARKLSNARVQAKIQASKIDPRFFETTSLGVHGILVRGKIRIECAQVIQEIADEDAAVG
jgi:hypothetical protein